MMKSCNVSVVFQMNMQHARMATSLMIEDILGAEAQITGLLEIKYQPTSQEFRDPGAPISRFREAKKHRDPGISGSWEIWI